MILVLIESPFAPIQGPEAIGLTDKQYAAAIADNIAFAKAAVRDCLDRNSAPYASHLFFPQDGIMDDRDPKKRKIGIEAGLLWGSKADLTAVYIDRGMSQGMIHGIKRAEAEGRPIVYRVLATGSEFMTYSEAILHRDKQIA